MIDLLLKNKDSILLLIAVVGFFLTIRTFSLNVKQRKIENTFKILDFMRKHISSGQIETFIELFHANNPLGVPPREFHFKNGRKDTVDNMFSEGGCGNGDIHNMIEIFNLIAVNLNRGELVDDLIWYEYGQIMTKCFEWTDYLEKDGPGKQYYDEVLKRSDASGLWERYKLRKLLRPHIDPKRSFFYHFNRFMRKQRKKQVNRPVKYYTYVE